MMDPSNTQISSEGQRISVLQVATPASVIVAAPASPGLRPAERTGIRVCESSTTTASALIVRQAGAGGTPIIVGLIPSDASGLSGLGNAAVFSVSPSTTAVRTSSSSTSTTIGSLVQITQVPQTGQTVYTSPTSQTGQKITKERSQTGMKSVKERSQTSQTSQANTKERSQTSQTSTKERGQTSQTSTKERGQTSQTSTKERGQSVGMSLGSGTGNPPLLAASTAATGGHGAGKPKSFAAMMAGIESPLASSKKQTASTKKSPGSKAATSKTQSSKIAGKIASTTTVADPHPTRASQRSVKRPKTYDEDLAELEQIAKACKKSKGGSKAGTSKSALRKTSRPRSSAAAKDLGRWRPTDDLMLISAVQQTNDLAAIHLGVKFSCRFTLREIEERWYALLYDPQISKIAVEAMRSLHPGVVTMALNNALWGQEEERVLAKIPSTDPGHLVTFQQLLQDNPSVFHSCRSATSLHHHWVLMGHYGLLNNQKVNVIPPGESITSFADTEDQLNDSELMAPRDVKEEALEQEFMIADRQAKSDIMDLEEELPQWRTIIDTGSTLEFGPDVYAILKGKVVEFLMTSREVTIGRGSPSTQVDFDLSTEGPAFKISRRQATIHLNDEGEFYIRNEGRRPLYLDGKAVVSGKQAKLQHQQLLEVASMSFLVLLNSKLAATVMK